MSKQKEPPQYDDEPSEDDDYPRMRFGHREGYPRSSTEHAIEQELRKAELRYQNGDKSVILHWLYFCIGLHIPIPLWLEDAFRNAYLRVTAFETKSWDDVFDRPLKKGKRLHTERRNREIARRVWLEAKDRKPKTKELFEEIGKKFGIGGTAAFELYKKVDRDEGDFPAF